MAEIGEIYTYPNNAKTMACHIAAKFCGVSLKERNISLADPPKDFTDSFPQGYGLVPAFRGKDGFCVSESIAILYYILNYNGASPLLGTTPKEKATVMSWMSRLVSQMTEVTLVAIAPYFSKDKSQPDLSDNRQQRKLYRLMKAMDITLSSSPYLAGDKLTVADIGILCGLLLLFKTGITKQYASQFPKVVAWVKKLQSEPNIKAVTGGTVEFTKEPLVKALLDYTP